MQELALQYTFTGVASCRMHSRADALTLAPLCYIDGADSSSVVSLREDIASLAVLTCVPDKFAIARLFRQAGWYVS